MFQKYISSEKRQLKIGPEILISDWVIFKNNGIGRVVDFKYLNGKTDKQKEFSKDSANVRNDNIGVLCSFYQSNLNSSGSKIMLTANKCIYEYRSISLYQITLPSPIIESEMYYEICIFNENPEIFKCKEIILYKSS